jgi:hypothetical protein
MGKRKFLAVVLFGLAGQVLAQPGASTQGPLLPRSLNVTPYVGQTIRVVVQANSCQGSPVGFIVDKVAVSGGSTLLNGSFESSLTSWNEDLDGCSINAVGAGDPIGYSGSNQAPVPTQGSALAASSAAAPGSCRLTQDVAITGAGVLTADVGWTFTRFSSTNPGCEVSLRLENPQTAAVLEQVIVFTPPAPGAPIPATPWWVLGLFTGLLAVFGAQRLGRS